MSLISEGQNLALFLVAVAAVVLSWQSEKTKVGRVFSGAIVAIVLGLVLSTFRIVPQSSFVYEKIVTYSVPLAIPLLLFRANLAIVFKASGVTMLAFALASCGVVVGVVVGHFLVDVGEHGNRWAGVFAASYTGGTLNFVSVSSALSLPETRIAAAIAADTAVGLAYLLALVIVSRSQWLLRSLSRPEKTKAHRSFPTDRRRVQSMEVSRLADAGRVIVALGLSLGIFVLSRALGEYTGMQQFTILAVTALSLLAANVVPSTLADSKGVFQFGTLLMYAFFFTVAVGADLRLIPNAASLFVKFLLVVLAVHIVVVAVGARLGNLRLPELVVGSCACVLGPGVAAAVAADRKWVSLVTPGILCGVLGYAVGNFIGISLAGLLA